MGREIGFQTWKTRKVLVIVPILFTTVLGEGPMPFTGEQRAWTDQALSPSSPCYSERGVVGAGGGREGR